MSQTTKTRNFRRRRQSSDDEDDSDSNDGLSSVVEDTKVIQKLRRKPHGVDAESLAPKVHTKEVKGKKDPFKMAQGGFVDMKALKRGIPDDMVEGDDDLDIGTTFAAETNRRDEDADMVKYVEEELARRKGMGGEKGSDDKHEQHTSKYMNPEDALYQLPDHLKALSSLKKTNEDMLSNQMLSGIPEVDLGIDAKIKNIEATEEAKAVLIRQKQNKRDAGEIFVPTNMAVNFVQHNRFNIEDQKPAQIKKAAPEPKPEPLRVGDAERPRTEQTRNFKRPSGSGTEKATDDFHYEKFKKHLRRY